jgi:hypothetical protein
MAGIHFIGPNLLSYNPPAAWTPADATNIEYFWRGDSGLTYDGSNNVSSWVDSVNGLELTPGAGTSPKYVASETSVNNQPVVNFGTVNTSEILNNTTEQPIAANTSFFFFFVHSTTTNANGGYQIIGGAKGTLGAGGHEFLIETNHPSYANSYTTYTYNVGNSGGVTTNTGVSISAPEISWVGLGYNSTSGDVTFYRNGSSTSIVNGSTDPDELAMCLGNYVGGGLPYYGKVAEWGFIKGSAYWDGSEGTDFATYVNTRYGIS